MSTALASTPRWTRSSHVGLVLRPIGDADRPFLLRLYASTRAAELAQVDWPDERKAAFVAMQFEAQHSHYETYYPAADRFVIVCGGTTIGRLYLERWPSQHRIMDISLLPAYCGGGRGTALLRDLMDEAADVGRAVSIHVEKLNPALRLYRRLGFVLEEDKGVYDLMRWTPDQPNTAS